MAASNKMKGSDEELLRVVRSDPDAHRRNEAAAELLRRYRDAVYLWCFRYTRDPERALDLSQEVLLGLWQKMGSFEGRSKFSSWAFTVTRNRCIDAGRRMDRLAAEEVPEDFPDPVPLADAMVEDRDDEERLLAVIRATLDPLEQDVVWLRCVEGMSLDEITRFLKIETASGSRAVLQRARRKLQAAMGRRAGREGGQS
jgi:RNA polymerase sigma-70 factor (ECF subfamily)